jgi:hypothetical protein
LVRMHLLDLPGNRASYAQSRRIDRRPAKAVRLSRLRLARCRRPAINPLDFRSFGEHLCYSAGFLERVGERGHR